MVRHIVVMSVAEGLSYTAGLRLLHCHKTKVAVIACRPGASQVKID